MTSAVRAREDAGLTLHEAARRARVHPRYLQRIEKKGGAPYVLAVRLAHIYGCSVGVFL